MPDSAQLDFKLDVKALGHRLTGHLDALREVDSLFWSEINQAWMVTGHKEVLDGYFGKLPLSSVRLPFLAVAHLSEEEQAQWDILDWDETVQQTGQVDSGALNSWLFNG